MRLTLRTLMAYLDDCLSSANAREIGKKLSDSPFAQELADRIRTVMRQRRLTTPGRKIKLIDPNLVAEYLDDQLTPELVSLIEKEVLSSDFSLAEAAASHEIIGLLGDPVDLHDRLRERLIKQNPNRSADEFDKVTQKKDSNPAQEVWKPLPPQKAFSPRSPTLILAVLLVGWIALMVREVSRPGPGHTDSVEHVDVADNDIDPAPEIGAGPASPVEGNEQKDGVSDSDLLTESDVTTPIEDGLVESLPDVVDRAASDPAGESADPQESPLEEFPPPQPDDAVSSGVESPEERSDEPDAPAESEPPPVRRFEYAVHDPNGMLLSRSLAGDGWSRTAVLRTEGPNRRDLVTNRVLALPEPFTSQMTPTDGGWSAMLISPCLVQFNDGVRPELRLHDGRCIIVQEVLNDDAVAREISLVVGGAEVKCSLSGEDLRLGVLVIPATAAAKLPDPNSISVPGSTGDQFAAEVDAEEVDAEALVQKSTERLPLDVDATVAVFVAGGSAVIHPDGEDPIQVGKGQSLQWTTVVGRVAEIQLSHIGQVDAIPDWVYTAGERAVPEIENAKTIFASRMESSGSSIEAARELCGDRNPLVARFAAAVLSVVREVESIVQVLLQTDEEQVRIEAIHGLRNAAAQTLPGRQAVLRALENRLPMRELGHFVRLLEGVTPADAQLEETSAWLVTMLRHDRASIRQMAIMILAELTGQTKGYHPDSDSGRRNDSVKRWERLLQQNGNRILATE